MSWKQPIDTSILEDSSLDALDRAVWCEIMLRCRNEDGEMPPFYHGNKKIKLFLKRGQMIFRVEQFARELKTKNAYCVRSSLRTWEKIKNEIKTETKPFGLIVTVLNYDSITNFKNETENELKTNSKRIKNELHTSNKIVKSDKSEKNIKRQVSDSDRRFPLEIEQSISDFKQHRKLLRKPLSEKAEELLRKKIEKKLGSEGKEKIVALFELAIERGWQGVFYDDPPAPPPKEQKIDHRQLATLQFIQENS